MLNFDIMNNIEITEYFSFRIKLRKYDIKNVIEILKQIETLLLVNIKINWFSFLMKKTVIKLFLSLFMQRHDNK